MTGYPVSETQARTFLTTLGCSQSWVLRVNSYLSHPPIFLGIALVLIVASLLAAPLLARISRQIDVSHVVVAVGLMLTATGLVLNASQWHASLEQEAMRKYESEIAVANKAEEPEPVRKMMSHLYLGATTAGDVEKIEYVYVELDNLEYALERYTHGFASAYTTSRAVMTFLNRCESPEFRTLARRQVEVASYSPVVVEAVRRIVQRFPPS
jgi:hypothetical protein